MLKQTINTLIMKRSIMICLVFFSLTAFLSCDLDETQTVTTFNNLVAEDNFDVDGAPDPNIWSFEIGDGTAQGIPGWGNNELQFYTDRTENVKVENGFLLITAKQELFNGAGYTSARLITKGKLETQYGRVEARMRLPFGQGMWPAFWMLGDDNNGTEIWPNIGEIDIMENRGQEPTKIIGSVHGPGYSGGNAVSKEYNLENDRFDTNFHVFGIEWGPNYINYYVDDVLYNQITPKDVPGEWVFDRPFYIIINLAVGGSFVGSPNNQTVFPQTMLVDYVRIYN
ncbi:glycoside hydrolase family 16 protein [Paucihalobacter ruber]|uniref:Glycoside hydrolase family 16 protein n=2 Tax=Paucihalobacter ruber TaxID=2567861 RepID=A0A506PJT9_9FLAO|nr:glycoside hydrolase family 16 protein [Paucihalobacter ruber]